MADREELGNMIDNIIKDNTEQSQVHFHNFTKQKIQELFYDIKTDSNDMDEE